MSLFAIGDTHLSFGTDKPMDIFRGWDDYVERLEENWRSVVSPEDTVVIPGDISWAMTLENALEDFRFLDSLPGTKIIMKGNHDYWWGTMRKMESFLESGGISTIKILHNNAYRVGDFTLAGTRGWFFDAESDADGKILAREVGRLNASVEAARKLGGELIIFLHYPPATETQVCKGIYDAVIASGARRCFYGHLHGFIPPGSTSFSSEGTKFSLISSDFLKFCPKLIEKF
ncbi:MAG: serine/threonine protein phosphatase [Clostridiales bacterium]|nr:serine/threonine protein phosphatase [Clostridiales bacterium]